MKYLVVQKQHGHGCDYTIGCGIRFDWIEAESISDVIEKIIWPNGHDKLSALKGERALSDILIIPEDYVQIVDVETVVDRIETMQYKEKRREKIQKELATLKRLKKKYSET